MDPAQREQVAATVLRITLREVMKDGTFDAAEKAALAKLCKALAIPQAAFDAAVAEMRTRVQPDPTAGSMDVEAVVGEVQAELRKAFEPRAAEAHATQIATILRGVADRPKRAAAPPAATPPAATPSPHPTPVPPDAPPRMPGAPPLQPPGPAAAAAPPPGAAAPNPAPAVSPAPAPAATPSAAAPPGAPPIPTTDEGREQRFIDLVEDSWELFDDIERTTWLDDSFLGEVITTHLENDRFLLDVTSDGVAHYLCFSSRERIRFIVKLDHSKAEDFSFAKSVGHLTTVTLGYSKAIPDMSKIMRAVKSEVKSSLAGQGTIEGYEDPGVIKIDAEGTFATAQTSLLIDLKDYVDPVKLTADRKRLWSDFSAVYQSLGKYLDGITQ